jgi:hypothetical protein
MGHFEGFFKGAETGSKRSRPPRKIPRNAPDKNNITHFQRYTGIFMSQYIQERETEGGRERASKREG